MQASARKEAKQTYKKDDNNNSIQLFNSLRAY
jgi:hypothetical protein